MIAYLLLLASVAVASEFQFLRTDADIPLQRRLADQEVPIKMCGSYETECIAVNGYSYKITTKHSGKESHAAETYSTSSHLYSGSDCSGSPVLEEEVTYKWTDYSVVTEYPYKVVGKRSVDSYSLKLNEWVYFGVPITCEGMELGKTYQLADIKCTTADGSNPLRSVTDASTTECQYIWKDEKVTDCDGVPSSRASNSGCSSSSAIVWVIVVVVVVIVVIVVVVLLLQKKKKTELKVQKEKDVEMSEAKKEKDVESVAQSVQPAAASTQPAQLAPETATTPAQPAQSVPESAQSAPEPAQSAVESTQPAQSAPEPAVESTQPAQPTAEPVAQPAAEPAQPVNEPVAQPAEPTPSAVEETQPSEAPATVPAEPHDATAPSL